MQPPPQIGPPGVSGPPPSGPNMFRRTRPHKHTAAATGTLPPVTQPMTDPFAFVRAPLPMAVGGPSTIPNSTPPLMQAPLNTTHSQAGSGLPPQLHTIGDVPAALPGPSSSSLPGLTLFSPQGAASPSVPPPSYTQGEQGYFNSREQTPFTASEPPHVTSAPVPSQTVVNQEFHARPPPQPVPFQPVPPTMPSSQWAPDHGSRPPSVQNYFQPTNDPPTQPFNLPPRNQIHPSHTPSPHHNSTTSSTQSGLPQVQAPIPPSNAVKAPSLQWPDPNVSQHHNAPFQTQSYFSQSSISQDPWFNQPPSDSGYHQMGMGLGHPQSPPDSAGSQHIFNTGSGAAVAPAQVQYSQEPGTLSMFFKENDVENEETLAGERNKAINGSSASVHHQIHPQAQSGHGEYQTHLPQEHSHLPYMSDGNYASKANTQKPPDSQDEHVENLEYVPNQEVLPCEIPSNPTATEVDRFETGPNLETPDSIPRPMRSASVSSNYSNMSHGSGTATRRHQGVVGTFIQQESPRLSDEASVPSARGGYFEQIDSSPAGDMGAQQSSLEQMWPPTPSPPKPTGNFQASANSSFEPVRSHGVGVRPPEVDRAKMEAEGGVDSTSGNLEQPPDNMENIYSTGHPLPAGVGGGAPHLTHPVVLSHSRPSSRAFGANRPCESPATTLWAQNDPSSLSTNILLAPAAPTLLAPLREPSADVIQPPEDGPLDLQPSQRTQPTSQRQSENLENPPKVSEAESTDSQDNLGYASLLVTESLHQPVLIAPPVSSYSVVPSGTLTQSPGQISMRESTPPMRPLAHGHGVGVSQSASITSSQNPAFASGPVSFNSSNQVPLNLARDNNEAKSEITAPPQSQPVGPPLSRAQSLCGESHSALHFDSQASLATAPVSNHNQPSNYELLDFSMHQSQTQNQVSGHPSSLHEPLQSTNGFYLQVTKDAQQGVKVKDDPPAQSPSTSSTTQVPPTTSQTAANTKPPAEPPKASESNPSKQGQNVAPPVSGVQPSHGQHPTPALGPATGNTPPPVDAYLPGPQGPVPPGVSQRAPAEPPRPPSSAGSQQVYGPSHPALPGQMYGNYYGHYGEYLDSRAPYPPGQYPPSSGELRAQHYQVRSLIVFI